MNALVEFALQPALAGLAIALSVFSLIIYLWLGLTILLAGDRRNMVTWASGVGLLLGALFFLSHGALVAARPTASGASPAGSSLAVDFWWRLSWLPAFLAPFLWALIGLRYTQLSGAWGRLRVAALAAVAGLGALTALLALLSWPAIAHYTDFIQLLDNSLRVRASGVQVSPWIPALGVAFVVYMAACALLPWAALAVRRLAPGIEARLSAPPPTLLAAAGTTSAPDGPAAPSTTPAERDLLWDPADAWERARPALLAASLGMVIAGGVVAVIGIGLVIVERSDAFGAISHTLPRVIGATAPGRSPLGLVLADLIVQGALAGLALMLGWAVVRQGVMVERRLPQRGFLSHWRRMAALAGAFAAAVAWMGSALPAALTDLLLLVALVAVTIALVTWQSYAAHDRLLAQLRPFMASLSAGQAGWLATDPAEVERGVDALFTSLCRDVLGAASGRLAISAGRLSHTFTYTTSVTPEQSEGWPFHWLPRAPLETRAWTLPVSDERGVVALMTLGPRVDGAGYTSADLEIARACGQRILDGVGGFATARAVASLARRRGLEAELTAALPRRTLHDEVLPRLHLAMLRLEALRARLLGAPVSGAGEARAVANASSVGEARPLARTAASQGREEAAALADDLGAVVNELGQAHRDLAKLMRAAPLASARRMEHGFTGALRGALDGEFRGVFDHLDWDAPEGAADAADALPPIVADLLLGATLEAARNAGRHGRGGDLSRQLTLRVRVAADPDWVTVEVADDGVGLSQAGAPSPGGAAPPAPPTPPAPSAEAQPPERPRDSEASPNGGARAGLLTHGALMALAGGSLTVRPGSLTGAVVTLKAPRSVAAS
ncbi:MAG TPA: hypothetical protein VF808_18430 [Ktedonobacterales bacterium]